MRVAALYIACFVCVLLFLPGVFAATARADEPVPLAPALTPTLAPTVPSTPQDATAAQGAGLPRREPSSKATDTWGELRGRYNRMPAFGSDTLGTPSGRSQWVQSRVIAGLRHKVNDKLQLDVELEALNGIASGDLSAVGTQYTPRPFSQARDSQTDLGRVLPRKAMVTYTLPAGQLTVGAQSFQWGIGMLAGDGAQDPDFGDGWMGNVVARVAFATKPLATVASRPLWQNLVTFVAADYVLRDDNASLADGDRAMAAVLGVRATEDALTLGALLAGRAQTDRADPWRPDKARSQTNAVAIDAFAKWLPSTGARRLGVEGEVAAILGHTTRPWGDEVAKDGAAVRQLGAVARLRFDDDALRLTAQLEAGYASGDNDVRDASARQFSMHSDHNVGMVLFEQVLPMIQARSIDRLADPSLVAVRPPSGRFAINGGGQVANAMYVHPVLRLRPTPPLDIRFGYVVAAAAADIADPYQTAINAGFATTAGGTPQGGRGYGHEFDVRATWDFAVAPRVVVRVGGEGGVLLPGSAFSGIAGLGHPWLTRGFLAVQW